MLRINLISGPRNLSTALMYSFAQRPRTRVLDEPYYALYLAKSGAQHPARAEVLATLPQTEPEVDALIFRETGHDILFIKNMAHHIEALEEEIKPGLKPVFLIRNPRHVIASYARVRAHPVMRDIGIEYQYHLFERMRRADGIPPVVVDSGWLLHDPRAVLTALCQRLGIPFYEGMLVWPAGPKPYAGIWASHWYGSVHQSQGFGKASDEDPDIPSHLEALCREAVEYYHNLLPFAINPHEHAAKIRPTK
ncbi:MAG TPA: hypothetical protein VF191_17280 [Cyclobacteriaceae bacterium]